MTCYDVAIVNKLVGPYQVLRSAITFSMLCKLSSSRNSNERLTMVNGLVVQQLVGHVGHKCDRNSSHLILIDFPQGAHTNNVSVCMFEK